MWLVTVPSMTDHWATSGEWEIEVLGLLLAVLVSAGSNDDPLNRLGVTATGGAAPGYVADSACRTCHAGMFDSYQRVGMARSFMRPKDADIERFGEVYYHEPSQRYYRIDRVGDGLVFHRWQLDANGQPVNQFEQPIDWVLGSGNRARSYLFQTEWGELYQLPLGWYTEIDGWGMSPGFEGKHHLGLMRRVQRQCMFCHNAYPDVPAGSDSLPEPHLFPSELPLGTGCQRCHGPGADHIRTALSGSTLDQIHAAIVNPAKLPPIERDSVCFQCHLLPAVSMVGSRRFGTDVYAFRPGQDLSDYMVHVDPTDAEISKQDRFEINHHGYRFWQSECYQQSAGELACFSCHDPHVKPESMAFRQQVTAVCTGCHEPQTTAHAEQSDQTCVDCHMPTRRTQDVILTTMTDHRIARGPFDLEALVAPLQKPEPDLTEIDVFDFGHPPTGTEARLYSAVAVLRTHPDPGFMNLLGNLLNAHPDPPTDAVLELARARLKAHQFDAALAAVQHLLKRNADFAPAMAVAGTALVGLGRGQEARAMLEAAAARSNTAESHYNLGLAFMQLEDGDRALNHLDRALALRPNMPLAYLYKARIFRFFERNDEAIAAYQAALTIDPTSTAAYRELITLFSASGRPDQADRYLELGRRVAREPELLPATASTDSP